MYIAFVLDNKTIPLQRWIKTKKTIYLMDFLLNKIGLCISTVYTLNIVSMLFKFYWVIYLKYDRYKKKCCGIDSKIHT